MRQLRGPLVAATAVFGLAACAVSTTERPYTPALIKQVGEGSKALAEMLPTFQSVAKTPGLFSDPATAQATAYVLQGQLNKVTAADLNRIRAADQNASTAFPGLIATFRRLESSIAPAMVAKSLAAGLPNGSKEFVDRWDSYLSLNLSTLKADAAAFSGFQPIYREIDGLVRAAYQTAVLRSTTQFDKVRFKVLADLRPHFVQLQKAMQGNRSISAAERQLVGFVNNTQEAQAIVSKVNHNYPGGWLGQDFKGSSG